MKWVALAFAAFVVALSVFTNDIDFGRALSRQVARIPGRDSTGHFLVMGLLSFFAILGFARARVAGVRLGTGGCIALVAAFVTVDELVQWFLPARAFSLADLGASYAGVLAFGLLAAVIRPASGDEGPIARGVD